MSNPTTNLQPSPLGVVVRAADGIFKVWRDGQWQVLDIETRPVEVEMEPNKPTFPGPYAAAYFSAAEEQEARRLAQRLDTASDHKRYSLSKIVTQVEERTKANVNPNSQQAFRRAVLTFLRGSRGPVDFGALLVRDPAMGGVGLSAEQSQAIVAVLSVIGDKIRSESGEVLDDLAPAARPTVAVAPRVETQNIASLQRTSLPMTLPTTPPAPAPVVLSTPIIPLAPRPMPPPSPSVLSDVVAAPMPSKRVLPRRLVGPVDELRQMDVVTFRTLGATPSEQASAVVAKVQALGRDSLTRRTEGLAAWRESEVYTIYRTIGIQSIQTGQSVAQVTAALFREGKPTLTEAEFNAVADCNQRLRY